MGHTENFIHPRSDGVDGSGAANFVVEFRSKFFTTGDDFFTLFAIWIPGVFGVGTGLLTEGGEGDLGKAIFNDLITRLQFILLPETELFRSLFNGLTNFRDLFVGQRVIIDLLPFFAVIAVILSALGDEKMEVL